MYWLARCQCTVTGWNNKSDRQIVSQCGSTHTCLSKSVPAGTLHNRQTTTNHLARRSAKDRRGLNNNTSLCSKSLIKKHRDPWRPGRRKSRELLIICELSFCSECAGRHILRVGFYDCRQRTSVKAQVTSMSLHFILQAQYFKVAVIQRKRARAYCLSELYSEKMEFHSGKQMNIKV